jgi:hypothetical protein
VAHELRDEGGTGAGRENRRQGRASSAGAAGGHGRGSAHREGFRGSRHGERRRWGRAAGGGERGCEGERWETGVAIGVVTAAAAWNRFRLFV